MGGEREVFPDIRISPSEVLRAAGGFVLSLVRQLPEKGYQSSHAHFEPPYERVQTHGFQYTGEGDGKKPN